MSDHETIGQMGEWKFTPSGAYSEQQEPKYIDHASQLDIALGLARPAYRQRRPVFFFLLSFPGAGKTSMIRPLWWRLNREGLRVSLLSINCVSIASRQPVHARRLLEDIRVQVNKQSNYPLLIVLDEAEALAPDREVHPAETTVCFWTINLLKELREAQSPVAVVAASNYPDHCDLCIRSEIGPCVYLPEASRELIRTLCIDRGIPNVDEFVEEYLILCTTSERVPLPRPLLDGLDNAPPSSDSGSARQLAEWVLSYGGHPSRSDFRKYEDNHEDMITRATRLREFLQGVAAQ